MYAERNITSSATLHVDIATYHFDFDIEVELLSSGTAAVNVPRR